MVRLTLLAAAAIFATVQAAPLEVAVHQATDPTPSPTHSPQLSQPVQASQTTAPTISATPATGSNAPTSPTPSTSVGASTTPSAAAAASGAPATSGAPVASGAPAASTAPTAPTPAAPAPVAGTPGVTEGTTGTEPLEIVESPMASPETSADPRPPCFPADATVALENGSVKRMDEIVVGDRVSVGSGKFSEVFMFTHKLSDIKQDFVSLETATGATLRLTAGHYLPVNGKYVPASEANVGDIVTVSSGDSTTITSISSVVGTGLYNPQTSHGDIVVDGVLASTYTTAVERKMAHAMLAPLRMLSDKLGLTTNILDAGCDAAARFTSVFA